MNTMIQEYWLPQMHASVELKRGEPNKAVETLRATAAYELSGDGALYAVYLRGLALLELHENKQAALEFQKILDHPGLVLMNYQGSLAFLGLARAEALRGDTANARAKISGISHALERCRRGHSHPEASQGRVREVAVIDCEFFQAFE